MYKKLRQDQIYASKNYDQFKLIDGNREIKSSKVNKLLDEIKMWGQVAPIIVDLFMKVIDGQHRLECCKILNIPVRYVVYEVKKTKLLELIRSINSVQSNWNNTDIAQAFVVADKNKEHYQRYLELISLGVSHSTVVEACSYLAVGEDKIRASYFDFKNGNLEIPQDVSDKVRGQISMLKSSSIEPKIWNRIYFIRALLKLRKQDDFNVYTFIENFNKFSRKWDNAYTVDENIKGIINIHNYKNRNKARFYIQ